MTTLPAPKSKLETHFLAPLADFYGKLKFGPGFAARLALYAESLEPEVLRSVADRLCETHNTFPGFKACSAALANAERTALAPISTAPREWDTKARDAEDWRARKAACLICRCEMGEQAVRDGWIIALIDFASDNGRLPDALEAERCKAKARKSEDALERARGSELFANLVVWRQNMLERARIDVFGAAA